jgi:outer membrane protein OmpA-like peptidoglycan-associated protein
MQTLSKALAALVLAAGTAALAQPAPPSEWTEFQSAPAPAPAPSAPVGKAPPTPALGPAPAPSPVPAKATRASARTLPGPAVKAAAAAEPAPSPPATPLLAPAASAPEAPPRVTTRESVLPGTELHSPGTAGNELTAPANLRVTASALGTSGLLHVSSADLGRPGVVRLSLLGEYFNSADFPVLGARDIRTAGTLALSYVFLRYAEAYLSYAASSNTNTLASPSLLQAQGDFSLGLKGALRVGSGLSVGADLRVVLYPGIGTQDLSRYAVGFVPRALATWDVRAASPKIPLRIHANVGFALDGTRDLAQGQTFSPVEEFALGINQYHRVALALGIEAPVPYVTPFVEYGLAYPLGVSSLTGPDNKTVALGNSIPQRLTLGCKVTALKDLTLLAAVDVGLTHLVARGIPATQPYNALLGVSYAFDPSARGETRLVERATTLEKSRELEPGAPSNTGKVAGIVLDASTREPLPGAVIAMAGSGLPPVASDVDGGKFLTHELPAGRVLLTFSRQGYRPSALDATVEPGKVASLVATLSREARGAAVHFALVSGRLKIPAGRVTLSGTQPAKVTAGADGTATIDLPKGHYTASAEADGYATKTRELDVPEAGELRVEMDLATSPKAALVVVKDDRIQIKHQIHFASGRALILADSNQLLDQVVDAILHSGIKKLRVEGHTDNQGDNAANLQLSRERASAVVDQLVRRGVDRSKLSFEGLGETRPVAPNLTARGREFNRRVDFLILER